MITDADPPMSTTETVAFLQLSLRPPQRIRALQKAPRAVQVLPGRIISWRPDVERWLVRKTAPMASQSIAA